MGAWGGRGGTGGHRVMTQNMLLSDSNPPNSATRSSVLLAHTQTWADGGGGGDGRWGEGGRRRWIQGHYTKHATF